VEGTLEGGTVNLRTIDLGNQELIHLKYDYAINGFIELDDENNFKKIKKFKIFWRIKEFNTKYKLFRINYSGKTKEDYLKKKAVDFYDAIIDIDSIHSLKTEKLKYNDERKEIYYKIINNETIKLGVLGINNVSK
jgi:hypothetical protein